VRKQSKHRRRERETESLLATQKKRRGKWWTTSSRSLLRSRMWRAFNLWVVATILASPSTSRFLEFELSLFPPIRVIQLYLARSRFSALIMKVIFVLNLKCGVIWFWFWFLDVRFCVYVAAMWELRRDDSKGDCCEFGGGSSSSKEPRSRSSSSEGQGIVAIWVKPQALIVFLSCLYKT